MIDPEIREQLLETLRDLKEVIDDQYSEGQVSHRTVSTWVDTTILYVEEIPEYYFPTSGRRSMEPLPTQPLASPPRPPVTQEGDT